LSAIDDPTPVRILAEIIGAETDDSLPDAPFDSEKAIAEYLRSCFAIGDSSHLTKMITEKELQSIADEGLDAGDYLRQEYETISPLFVACQEDAHRKRACNDSK
jgi:hypothetical protein